MENNAWDVAKEVKERIHDAPVLKEYITAYLTMKPEDQIFWHLIKQRVALRENKFQVADI